MEIQWHGESLILPGDRTLFWPKFQLLCAADVHLGKAATFRDHGLAVPEGSDVADLQRLAAAVCETGSKTVLFLGDLVHHESGVTSALVGQFAQWRNNVDANMVLVRGNYDRCLATLPASWRMLSCDVIHETPFAFCHDPADDAGCGVIARHVNPVYVQRGAGDALRLPCFYVQQKQLILPAFTSFAGGADRRTGDRHRGRPDRAAVRGVGV